MKTAILGKQNPMKSRVWMAERIRSAGHEADILDMQTRTFLDFADQLMDYDAVITCGEKIPKAAMETLGKGRIRLISRWGVGTDEMDHDAATRNGIAICNAAGSLSTAVAECAISMMIDLLRQFPERDASVRNNDWSWFFEGRVSRQLEGKTVGLYGFGDIAKALAKMLYGFDCRVLGYSRHWNAETAKQYHVEYADLDTMLAECDIISLHAPATPATENMVNADFLRRMKKDAILINTGRGKLVDEDALVEALQNGTIAAAGLDVFKSEPPAPDHPLLKLKNVIVLPHSGAGTEECLRKASAMACDNVIDFFEGRPVKTIRNPGYVDHIRR